MDLSTESHELPATGRSPVSEDLLSVTLVVLVALLAGGLVGLLLGRRGGGGGRGDQAALVATLREELDVARRETRDELAAAHRQDLEHALSTLQQVAGEQLDARVRAGASELGSRKELIDAELAQVSRTLSQVTDLVQRLDRERASQLGQVTEQLQGVARSHGELASTTAALREALASSQARGQWGERMAEDVLRAAGFVEGVNYRTQASTPGGSRPDVTFLLPGDQVLHMDVKFPLGNYLAMLEAEGDTDRDDRLAAFLRDVRARVKELAERDYVDPQNGTLDCVLLFLPNEQVYGFVHEHDPTLLDDALSRKVVLCSPTTLFAVLAVIRQAVDRVALERVSDEILQLLAGFADQWERFVVAMDKVGRGLETTTRAYDALATTRRGQLERQLKRIDELRRDRGVEAVLVDGARPHLVALDETPGGQGDAGRAADDDGR